MKLQKVSDQLFNGQQITVNYYSDGTSPENAKNESKSKKSQKHEMTAIIFIVAIVAILALVYACLHVDAQAFSEVLSALASIVQTLFGL